MCGNSLTDWRKKRTVATTITEREYLWILKRIEDGEAINQADLLRMALRMYMEKEREKEDYITVERKIRLREKER